MERIGYPQSSVEMRSYSSQNGRQQESAPPVKRERPAPVTDKEMVLGQRGEKSNVSYPCKIPAERYLAGGDCLGGTGREAELPERPGAFEADGQCRRIILTGIASFTKKIKKECLAKELMK